MTTENWQEAKRIFEGALDLEPAERNKYLATECSGNSVLRDEVECLLKHDAQNSTFLQHAVIRIDAQVGRVIGPYHLIHLIGLGGMGEVWLAEQTHPVRRRVALKLIKAGMDTREVIARFELERQTLALMDHPTIAKVFDAGSTPQGRPFFVMEYVGGMPITKYCDTHKLSIRDRLKLIARLCEGVQHAHQKAVIHRDLKPSNILVAEVDGNPVPTIIDFGIAKVLLHEAGGVTFTSAGSVLGTPEYMSPEQAQSAGTDIDTRTDVYSLGVILYEVLAGIIPYDFRKLSLIEVARRLHDEDEVRLSSKIRMLDSDASKTIAANRHTDRTTLLRQLSGDLDSIALKAMAKDRTRRYQTPSELSSDITRYLRNEPVTARAGSMGYRAQKYVARHRAGVSIWAGIVLMLACFALVQTSQLRRITRERDRADRITRFMTNMFKLSDPNESHGAKVTAREILNKASLEIGTELAGDPQLEAEMTATMGTVYSNLGLYAKAEVLLTRAISLRRRVFPQDHPDTLTVMNDLGKVLAEMGRYSEAEKLHRDAIEAGRRTLGTEHPVTLLAMNKLANDLVHTGRYEEAHQLLRRTISVQRRVVGWEYRDTLNTMNDLAGAISQSGASGYADAEALYREVLEIRRRVLGPNDRDTLISMNNLGNDLSHLGRYEEAQKLLHQALQIETSVLGPDAPETAATTYNLACIAALTGDREQAVMLLRAAVQHGLPPRALLSIAADPDLKLLHGEARFEAIVMDARRRAAARTGQ